MIKFLLELSVLIFLLMCTFFTVVLLLTLLKRMRAFWTLLQSKSFVSVHPSSHNLGNHEYESKTHKTAMDSNTDTTTNTIKAEAAPVAATTEPAVASKEPEADSNKKQKTKRYLPEHKKPDAALTFPEKVRVLLR